MFLYFFFDLSLFFLFFLARGRLGYFYSFFVDQVFDQIFGQGFEQGLGEGKNHKYSVQYYPALREKPPKPLNP